MVKFDLKSEAPHLDEILTKVYSGRLKVTKILQGAHDINWTKEYELFYSEQPKSQPFVRRLFFKDGNKSYGFVHLRPVSDWSKVTESYLAPPKDMDERNGYFIKCQNKFEEYGESINCVPFIMPETIFGMCVHGSIWICLKILENTSKGIVNGCDIPNIQTLASGRPFADGEGLFFVQVSRLLRMCNCGSFYTGHNISPNNDSNMLFSLYSYVESGLPVIIGVDVKDLKWWDTPESGYHSVVVIGHTMKEGMINGFIVHDESKYPYQILTVDELLEAFHGVQDKSNIREFAVAVPSQVGLRFEIALQEFLMFRDKLFNLKHIEWRGIESLRPMLMSPKDFYHHFFSETSLNKYRDAINLLIETLLRRIKSHDYFWVFFFYQSGTKRTEQEDIGFYMRDATLDSDFRLIFLKDEMKLIFQENFQIYSMVSDVRGIPRKKKIES